jgi:hypothetical protein
MIRKEWFTILILVLFVATAVFFDFTAHRDVNDKVITAYADGTPVKTAGRFEAVYLLPIVAILLYALFALISRITVYKPHVDNFFEKFFGFKLVMILLLYVIYLSLMLTNYQLDSINQTTLIVTVAISFWYVSHLFHHLRSDYFSPWVKGRNAMWEETHEIGTWLFRVCAVLVLFSLIQPKLFVFFVAVPLFATVFMIILYGYIIFQQEHHLGVPAAKVAKKAKKPTKKAKNKRK